MSGGERMVAGCMTGTSIDSLDAALVRVGGEGPAMSARFVRGVTRPLGELAPRLRRLAEQEPMTAGDIARLSGEFAALHARALGELFAAGGRADLVAVHGQTVFHAPPLSWQILNAAPIARAIGAPVVFDLRAADLAAGGQGAPITPMADWVLLGGQERRAVVNLGGFCNVSLLPIRPLSGPALRLLGVSGRIETEVSSGPVSPRSGGSPPHVQDGTGERAPNPDAPPFQTGVEAIRGGDVCPCNHLLDTIARTLFDAPFDADGVRASAGSVHDHALEDLDGVVRSRRRPGKSLGTGDECAEWVSRWRAHASGEDLAATACEVIGRHIAAAVAGADRVLLAGGGVRNRALAGAIESCCSARVEPTDAYGLPAEYREAACMGVLGALCRDRVPITLPRVTGVPAPAPVAGTWIHP